MTHFVAACRSESESSGMLFRELGGGRPDGPEPTLDQLEKLARAHAEWRAEGLRFGVGRVSSGTDERA